MLNWIVWNENIYKYKNELTSDYLVSYTVHLLGRCIQLPLPTRLYINSRFYDLSSDDARVCKLRGHVNDGRNILHWKQSLNWYARFESVVFGKSAWKMNWIRLTWTDQKQQEFFIFL